MSDIFIVGTCEECFAPVGVDNPYTGNVPIERMYMHLYPLNGECVNCNAWMYGSPHRKPLQVIPWQGWPPSMACKVKP